MIKSKKTEFRISVHQFVDMLMQGGDLILSSMAGSRMIDGMSAHVMRQSQSDQDSEVTLRHTLEGIRCMLTISGRADIIDNSGSYPVIEEIKSTYAELENIQDAKLAHMTQCKCYAAMFLQDSNTADIGTRITYVKLPESQTLFIDNHFTRDEILDWFDEKCNMILSALEDRIEHELRRDESLIGLGFPFDEYRDGQREMIEKVYKACKDSEKLFVQAPTGIGKTMASIFPAIKSLVYTKIEKIFYITAKNTIKIIASKTIQTLRDNDLFLRSITLSSKEFMCPTPNISCHPLVCPRAKGYYDRQRIIMDNLEDNMHYSQKNVKELADRYNICPHELALDISLECDVVICDYNHVYDPRAKLKRYFYEGGDYVILADEAHNLISRGRDMFSAAISSDGLKPIKRFFRTAVSGNELLLLNILKALDDYFSDIKKTMIKQGEVTEILSEPPDDLRVLIEEFMEACEPLLDTTGKRAYANELNEIYFTLRHYIIISNKIDERYRVFYRQDKRCIEIKLFCMDPSQKLQECHDKISATVMFSASLSPEKYFTRLLVNDDVYDYADFPSPFPKENLTVFATTYIPTLYRQRESSLFALTHAIHAFINRACGNYLVLFPSYVYMEMVHSCLISLYDIFAPKQERGMSDVDRKAFLSLFDEEKTLMSAFAVMGGIFSEGIDLIGDKLIGVIIVGTAMPGLSFESNLLKKYHDDMEESGFDYAYTYPGFNRVLQGVGRVIRTKEDKGNVLLIDNRFTRENYLELMPCWWKPLKFVDCLGDIEGLVRV